MSNNKKVPLYLQKLGSEDCGPIATLMILGYFDKTSDVKEVLTKVPRSYFGTTTFDNATVLLDYGLKVDLVTRNPLIFDGDFIRSKPSGKEVKQRINEVTKKEKKSERKEILEGLLTFINKENSKLKLDIPSKDIIIEALGRGKLILASIYAKALGVNQGGYHFVVIAGIDKDKLLVLNPWPKSRQESWEDIDEVVYAIHTSTMFDYDNGSILIVGS